MNLDDITTAEQIKSFLDGSQSVIFEVASNKDERYAWIRKTLYRVNYRQLPKKDRGLVIKLLCKTSDYSRQQITRLISAYLKNREIKRKQRTVNGFQRHYDMRDIALLVTMDELHGTPSGGVLKKLCERANVQLPEAGYQRLAGISIAHLYNLRKSHGYLRARHTFTKTKSTKIPIAVRRKPQPNEQPGYLRVDTVHQGDLDGIKGVYYINAVDEVTQFEIVACVEKISEAYLMPVLELLLAQFPFAIKGFHSDNGSEYINYKVAALLEKLLIEFTKSRPRHSGDNGLVESKNGAVIRKHFGYSHIPQAFASLINDFNQAYLNPHINYHRPCYFPTQITNDKGKVIKKYRYCDMMTPFEKFKSLPNAKTFLKHGGFFEQLDKLATHLSDNESARLLTEHKMKLFNTITEQTKRRA